MLIYLASPYSNPDKDIQELRYLVIQEITARLMKKGFVVFSPIVYGHYLAKAHELPTDWEYWRHTLEEMVPRYDELWVVMIEGWQDSKGVHAEIAIAKLHNIPVKYLKPEDL